MGEKEINILTKISAKEERKSYVHDHHMITRLNHKRLSQLYQLLYLAQKALRINTTKFPEIFEEIAVDSWETT